MRVAYLVSQYPAASHTFIRREVVAVRAAGIEVDVFSVRRPEPDEHHEADARVAYEETEYLLPFRVGGYARAHVAAALTRPRAYARTLRLALRHRVPGARALTFSFVYFAEAIVLARSLQRRRIDHLHNHFANPAAIVGLLASRFLSLPWSLTLHGVSETDYPAGNLLRAKLEAADFAACVSHFGRAQAFRLLRPELWDRLFIVRCGVDLAALPEHPAEPAVPHRGTRFVCVGRLSAEKGHAGLVGAFAAAWAGGADAQLVLVGDGLERGRIEAVVAEHGLAEHVVFRDRLPEAATLAEIAASDVLVLASFMEGLPVVLMEAMALGRPVIAPRVAGIPELVVDGVNGRLFTPGVWSELAECMRSLSDDPALRARLGAAGRDRVLEEFDVRVAVVPLVAKLRAMHGEAFVPRAGDQAQGLPRTDR